MHLTNDTNSRQLGFWMTWAVAVGTMIGSGIFMLPASLAPFGVNAVAGWVLSGIGAVALAFCIGRLATAANALLFLAGVVLAGEQLAGYFLAGDA